MAPFFPGRRGSNKTSDYRSIILLSYCLSFQWWKHAKKNQNTVWLIWFSPTSPSHTHTHTAEVRVSGEHQFCRTWGNYHFSTFDGDFFQLPSTCSYILTKHCGEVYDAFNIQVQREEVEGVPTFKKATLKLEGALVELADSFVSVDGKMWVG